jgi:hypothetical protein
VFLLHTDLRNDVSTPGTVVDIVDSMEFLVSSPVSYFGLLTYCKCYKIHV